MNEKLVLIHPRFTSRIFHFLVDIGGGDGGGMIVRKASYAQLVAWKAPHSLYIITYETDVRQNKRLNGQQNNEGLRNEIVYKKNKTSTTKRESKHNRTCKKNAETKGRKEPKVLLFLTTLCTIYKLLP